MEKKTKLYKFTAGAKEDLLALHNEFVYSDIVKMLKGKLPRGNVVIKLRGLQVTGITLNHLDKPARFYNFKCVICFDAKKVQVGDPCNFCDGSGCKDCENGLNFKLIACPNCTGKQETGDRDEWHDRVKVEREQSHGNRWTLPRQTPRVKRRKAG